MYIDALWQLTLATKRVSQSDICDMCSDRCSDKCSFRLKSMPQVERDDESEVPVVFNFGL